MPNHAGIAALVMLLSASSALKAAHRVDGTSIHHYTSFDGGTIPTGVEVGRAAPGSCRTTSLSTDRPDAFRCVVGNYIYDPCFADETAPSSFVLGPLYWPTSKVLRITIINTLPSNNATGDPTR
jgi:hypothetical protein